MIKLRSLRRMSGLALIELMIASLLGIVITIFITEVMVSSGNSNRQSEGVSQAHENGRFITSWIQDRARKAGFTHSVFSDRTTPFATVCPPGTNIPPAAGGGCTFNIDTADSDRIAIRREFSDRTPETQRTCTGVQITPAMGINNEDVLIDVIWQDGNAGAEDNFNDVLRCVTYSEATGDVLAPPQVIANGVEGLQFLYGVATTEDQDSDVTAYVNADNVTDWDLVRAVRIAVLSRSFSDSSLGISTRSYVLLDSQPQTNRDQIVRSVQTLTVQLLNE